MDLKNLGLRLGAIGEVLAAMEGDAADTVARTQIGDLRADRLLVALSVFKTNPDTLRLTLYGDKSEMDIDCGSDGAVHMYADYSTKGGNEAWRGICQFLRDKAKSTAG